MLLTLKYLSLRQQKGAQPNKGYFNWRGSADLKRAFGNNVDFVGDNRAIFDIGGNKYRLVVRFSYTFKTALIKFVGTHAEYDGINAETV